MKILIRSLLLVLLLKTVENRLENLLKLFDNETQLIYKKRPGTLEKYFQSKPIQHKFEFQFDKFPLISDNETLINPKIVEDLQKKFDEEKIRWTLVESFSEEILKKYSENFDERLPMIFKFDGKYLGKEETEWVDVHYHVNAEIQFENVKNFSLFYVQLCSEFSEFDLFAMFWSIFEWFIVPKYFVRYNLEIEFNGFSVEAKKMTEFSLLIQEKGLNGTEKYLEENYLVTLGDL